MKKITLLYGFFLTLLVGFTYLFIDPNFIYLKQIYTGFFTTHRSIATITYCSLLTVFFGFYVYFIYNVQKKKYTQKEVIFFVVVSAVGLILSYPTMLSYDIFNYTTTSKVLFGYMENPYVVMPVEFSNEPFLLYTHAANKYALYGPFWLFLTGLPYLFGFGNILLTILGFKVIAATCYFLILYFIWKLTNNLKSVVIFGLNPLVLIETMVSGHNDVVMMALALASFYFLKSKRNTLAIVLFILSILIKYATIFLIPVYLIVLWLNYKKRKIEWMYIYTYAALCMLVIFLLSPLREEVYPWYWIWVFSFITLLVKKKDVVFFSIVFSFFLMFRYVPFMMWGNHFGITPMIKNLLTGIPLALFASWTVFSFFKNHEK